MKGFTKKLMAGALAASMVMSTSLVAFAEDPAPAGTGTSSGSGSLEGVVETDVYTADLPTQSTTAYNYIVDPQGLIRKTNAAAYSGKTFDEGTLFFPNASGEYDYSNTSDAAKITNKSSKNLSVKVTATATPDSATGAAALATTKTFAETNKNLEVYLGITDSVDGSTEKALAATPGVEMTAVLGAAPEDAYEYKYSSTDSKKYSYALKSDVSAFKFAEYSFQINGAANANAAWKADTAVPAVSVKWDVDLTDDAATVATPEQTPPAPAEAAPSVTTTTANLVSGQPLEISVDLGAGDKQATGIAKVSFVNDAGVTRALANTNYTFANGKITFIESWVTAQIPAIGSGNTRTYTVTFDDGDSTTGTFTVTAP